MAKKQGPLYLVAREFLERFPSQRRFGVASTEKLLVEVMAELGTDPADLLWRIRQWSKTRTDLTPRHLLKPLPARPIKEVKPPAKAPVPIPDFPDEWKGRASSYYLPYEDDIL